MPFIERIRAEYLFAVNGNANFMRSSRERNERITGISEEEEEKEGGGGERERIRFGSGLSIRLEIFVAAR